MDCGNVTAAALVNMGAVVAEADVAPAIEKTAVRRAIVWRPNRVRASLRLAHLPPPALIGRIAPVHRGFGLFRSLPSGAPSKPITSKAPEHWRTPKRGRPCDRE